MKLPEYKPISALQARLLIAKFRNAYPAITKLHQELRKESKETKAE